MDAVGRCAWQIHTHTYTLRQCFTPPHRAPFLPKKYRNDRKRQGRSLRNKAAGGGIDAFPRSRSRPWSAVDERLPPRENASVRGGSVRRPRVLWRERGPTRRGADICVGPARFDIAPTCTPQRAAQLMLRRICRYLYTRLFLYVLRRRKCIHSSRSCYGRPCRRFLSFPVSGGLRTLDRITVVFLA